GRVAEDRHRRVAPGFGAERRLARRGARRHGGAPGPALACPYGPARGPAAGVSVVVLCEQPVPPPPGALPLVDWADEEGARFGRSLLGSSAAAGSLKVDEVRELRDADGTRLEDALRDHGVSLDTMLNARGELARIDARAYLEMHIEQGPVLESLNRSAGVVL